MLECVVVVVVCGRKSASRKGMDARRGRAESRRRKKVLRARFWVVSVEMRVSCSVVFGVRRAVVSWVCFGLVEVRGLRVGKGSWWGSERGWGVGGGVYLARREPRGWRLLKSHRRRRGSGRSSGDGRRALALPWCRWGC